MLSPGLAALTCPCPRYLLSHGANIAAVNSDGDLPLDLAESDAMEGLLKAEITRRGGPVREQLRRSVCFFPSEVEVAVPGLPRV